MLTVDDVPAIWYHSLQLQILDSGITVDLVKPKRSGQVTGSLYAMCRAYEDIELFHHRHGGICFTS